MFGLSDGEEIMTLAFFVLIQYRSVTDRQTDRRTSLLWLYRRLHSLLCYRAGKNYTVNKHGAGDAVVRRWIVVGSVGVITLSLCLVFCPCPALSRTLYL